MYTQSTKQKEETTMAKAAEVMLANQVSGLTARVSTMSSQFQMMAIEIDTLRTALDKMYKWQFFVNQQLIKLYGMVNEEDVEKSTTPPPPTPPPPPPSIPIPPLTPIEEIKKWMP
jgi:hypothetical protein